MSRRAEDRGTRRVTWRAGWRLGGLVLLGLLGGSGLGPGRALAGHGGVVRLSAVAAGPYAVSVWTQPTPPRAGPSTVDVAVMEPGTRAPVLDAVVRLHAEPASGGARVGAEARRADDPLGVRYRADLPLGDAGPWAVTVSVSGPAGTGEARFALDVLPGRRGGALVWGALGLAGAGGAGLVAIRRAGRRRGVGAAAVLLVLLAAGPAWPHASLVKSSPARRATLTRAPERAQLWFNEPIEARFSRLSVWDRAGQQADLGDARVAPEDPKQLSVGLRPLSPGAYTVKFRVLSVDGHVVESEFLFTIRAP